MARYELEVKGDRAGTVVMASDNGPDGSQTTFPKDGMKASFENNSDKATVQGWADKQDTVAVSLLNSFGGVDQTWNDLKVLQNFVDENTVCIL